MEEKEIKNRKLNISNKFINYKGNNKRENVDDSKLSINSDANYRRYDNDFNVTIGPALSISEFEKEGIKIYPNPSTFHRRHHG